MKLTQMKINSKSTPQIICDSNNSYYLTIWLKKKVNQLTKFLIWSSGLNGEVERILWRRLLYHEGH